MSYRPAPANKATATLHVGGSRAEVVTVFGDTPVNLYAALSRALITYARKQGVHPVDVQYMTKFETV